MAKQKGGCLRPVLVMALAAGMWGCIAAATLGRQEREVYQPVSAEVSSPVTSEDNSPDLSLEVKEEPEADNLESTVETVMINGIPRPKVPTCYTPFGYSSLLSVSMHTGCEIADLVEYNDFIPNEDSGVPGGQEVCCPYSRPKSVNAMGIITHYDPALGGINGDGDPRFTARGDRVLANDYKTRVGSLWWNGVNAAGACPKELELGDVVLASDYNIAILCIDRGSKIDCELGPEGPECNIDILSNGFPYFNGSPIAHRTPILKN